MNFVYYLHDITDIQVFRKELIWLKSHYELVGSNEIKEYLYGCKPLINCCHITIDDGWKSTYTKVFPIIKELRIPITIFVSPEKCRKQENFWYMEYKGYDENFIKDLIIKKGFFSSPVKKYPLDLILKELEIDTVYDLLDEYRINSSTVRKEANIITISELTEMRNSGLVEIGAHTQTHPILSNENSIRAKQEIIDSINELENILDIPVRTFAYPNGLYQVDFTDREKKLLEDKGIELAYSVDPGALQENTDPLNIPRIGSLKRLKLGRIGVKLPSLHNQKGIRKEIRKYKL